MNVLLLSVPQRRRERTCVSLLSFPTDLSTTIDTPPSPPLPFHPLFDGSNIYCKAPPIALAASPRCTYPFFNSPKSIRYELLKPEKVGKNGGPPPKVDQLLIVFSGRGRKEEEEEKKVDRSSFHQVLFSCLAMPPSSVTCSFSIFSFSLSSSREEESHQSFLYFVTLK